MSSGPNGQEIIIPSTDNQIHSDSATPLPAEAAEDSVNPDALPKPVRENISNLARLMSGVVDPEFAGPNPQLLLELDRFLNRSLNQDEPLVRALAEKAGLDPDAVAAVHSVLTATPEGKTQISQRVAKVFRGRREFENVLRRHLDTIVKSADPEDSASSAILRMAPILPLMLQPLGVGLAESERRVAGRSRLHENLPFENVLKAAPPQFDLESALSEIRRVQIEAWESSLESAPDTEDANVIYQMKLIRFFRSKYPSSEQFGKTGDPGWDFKRIDLEKYEEFGNFMFGFLGTKLGLSSAVLTAGAAWFQNDKLRLFLKDPVAFARSFGDEPGDRPFVLEGIAAARRR